MTINPVLSANFPYQISIQNAANRQANEFSTYSETVVVSKASKRNFPPKKAF